MPHVVTILRRITALDGPVRIRAVLDVRAGFGAEAMRKTHRSSDGTWTGRSGPIWFRWTGAPTAHRGGAGPLTAELEITPGQAFDLVLELSDVPLADDVPDPKACWSATEAAWSLAVPDLGDGVLGPRDAEMAMAVLSGLTSSDGGMVAAATMSLPERAGANRNYDYRYAWIRDQCYAGQAVAAHGHFPLLDSAVSFVSARLLADGPELKPAYTVAGGRVPDERSLPHLAGYPGGTDKVGNWVNQQFQLDAFGEALELFAAASSLDRLDTEHWDAVETAVAAIEAAMARARCRNLGVGQWSMGPLSPYLRFGAPRDRQGSSRCSIGPVERPGRRDPGRCLGRLPPPRWPLAACPGGRRGSTPPLLMPGIRHAAAALLTPDRRHGERCRRRVVAR